VTRLKWKLNLVHLQIVLIFRQDRCMLCVGRTIGSEIVLDEPDVTPRRLGWCGNFVSGCLETVLVSVQERCTVCAKRIIGSEIVLDKPDGTPRGRDSSGSSIQSALR
jgi:hypothetical protein